MRRKSRKISQNAIRKKARETTLTLIATRKKQDNIKLRARFRFPKNKKADAVMASAQVLYTALRLNPLLTELSVQYRLYTNDHLKSIIKKPRLLVSGTVTIPHSLANKLSQKHFQRLILLIAFSMLTDGEFKVTAEMSYLKQIFNTTKRETERTITRLTNLKILIPDTDNKNNCFSINLPHSLRKRDYSTMRVYKHREKQKILHECPVDTIIDMFNNTVPQAVKCHPVAYAGKAVQEAVKKLYLIIPHIQKWAEYFEMIKQSSYLSKSPDFTPSFFWFCKPETYEKIVNGMYASRPFSFPTQNTAPQTSSKTAEIYSSDTSILSIPIRYPQPQKQQRRTFIKHDEPDRLENITKSIPFTSEQNKQHSTRDTENIIKSVPLSKPSNTDSTPDSTRSAFDKLDNRTRSHYFTKALKILLQNDPNPSGDEVRRLAAKLWINDQKPTLNRTHEPQPQTERSDNETDNN